MSRPEVWQIIVFGTPGALLVFAIIWQCWKEIMAWLGFGWVAASIIWICKQLAHWMVGES